MAQSAQTLINLAYALQYSSLNERDLLLCLVGYYSSLTGLTAQAAVNGAAANKYAALSDDQLQKCLVEVLS